jgi:hypothetical protein
MKLNAKSSDSSEESESAKCAKNAILYHAETGEPKMEARS